MNLSICESLETARPELLEELQRCAADSVSIEDDYVVIQHLYVERRVRPLNLYLAEADEPATRAAVIDFGQTVKDLAATNIFPGDIFPKNFGLTRDDEIIVNHCGLEPLFIQVRSECVTLCSGELTRVCAYPPKFVLKSQDPRFHGVLSRSC